MPGEAQCCAIHGELVFLIQHERWVLFVVGAANVQEHEAFVFNNKKAVIDGGEVVEAGTAGKLFVLQGDGDRGGCCHWPAGEGAGIGSVRYTRHS